MKESLYIMVSLLNHSNDTNYLILDEQLQGSIRFNSSTKVSSSKLTLDHLNLLLNSMSISILVTICWPLPNQLFSSSSSTEVSESNQPQLPIYAHSQTHTQQTNVLSPLSRTLTQSIIAPSPVLSVGSFTDKDRIKRLVQPTLEREPTLKSRTVTDITKSISLNRIPTITKKGYGPARIAISSPACASYSKVEEVQLYQETIMNCGTEGHVGDDYIKHPISIPISLKNQKLLKRHKEGAYLSVKVTVQLRQKERSDDVLDPESYEYPNVLELLSSISQSCISYILYYFTTSYVSKLC